jgi:hypothetical protein
MTPRALLERLTAEGVAVRLEGGDICLLPTPPRTIDDALVAELRAAKPEIIAELRRRERNGDKAALPPSQPVSEPFTSRWMNFPAPPRVRTDRTDKSPPNPPSVSFVSPDPRGAGKNSRAASGEPGERRPDVPMIGDPVLVAARLLRECRWAVVPPVCSFLIGQPGEACRRCGASWLEHYPT